MVQISLRSSSGLILQFFANLGTAPGAQIHAHMHRNTHPPTPSHTSTLPPTLSYPRTQTHILTPTPSHGYPLKPATHLHAGIHIWHVLTFFHIHPPTTLRLPPPFPAGALHTPSPATCKPQCRPAFRKTTWASGATSGAGSSPGLPPRLPVNPPPTTCNPRRGFSDSAWWLESGRGS